MNDVQKDSKKQLTSKISKKEEGNMKKVNKSVVKEHAKGRGRPPKYNRDFILNVLRKYENQPGGLLAAHTELMKVKGYQNISYGYVAILASDNEIHFIRGAKSQEFKEAILKKESAKKKAAATRAANKKKQAA